MKKCKLIFSLVAALFCVLHSQAQTADMLHEDTLLLAKPLLGFWAGPTMVQPIQLDGVPTSQNISPHASFSGQLGFDYVYPLGIHLAIRTGLQFADVPYRIRLDLLRYPSNGLATDIQHQVLSDYRYWFADVPVQFEFRRRGGQHHYQVLRLGVVGMFSKAWEARLHTLGQQGSATTDSKVFELNIGSSTGSFVRPGFAASVGIYSVQKNHHFVSVQVAGRYLLKPMLKGTYELFPGTTDYVNSTAKLSGSYIGLEIGYTLTKFKEEEEKSQ